MNAVARHGVSIALARRTFGISETCYRYSPILSEENEEIADWLERLTANKHNWCFGLCFLYLHNVQDYGWNHKRVYRVNCELELLLRIKPNKRLKRDKPEPLVVPERSNETWSMDLMADQLADWRSMENSLIIHPVGLNLRSGEHKEGGVGASLTSHKPQVYLKSHALLQYPTNGGGRTHKSQRQAI